MPREARLSAPPGPESGRARPVSGDEGLLRLNIPGPKVSLLRRPRDS